MNNSITIAYRFEITLQLCVFDGSKPKNNDELQPRLSNFFKNFDCNGGGRWWLKGGDGGEVLQACSLKNNPFKGSTLSEMICVGCVKNGRNERLFIGFFGAKVCPTCIKVRSTSGVNALENSFSDAWPPESCQTEFVCSSYGQNSGQALSVAYGISHGWFKRKEFYITRYTAPSDRNAVRSHMTILSVVSLKTLSKYDKLNHLSGADKVHLFNAINLWIRNIVIRQRVEDVQLSIKSYQTKLNLTQPRWDETDFLFKEDYTIVHKPRVVIYRDRNNQKMMMRETEVHKFSDGTLTRILEKAGCHGQSLRVVQVQHWHGA
ncbi:hypothetical protein Tco_0453821 [Tanacetum coccineum]